MCDGMLVSKYQNWKVESKGVNCDKRLGPDIIHNILNLKRSTMFFMKTAKKTANLESKLKILNLEQS